MALKHSHRWGDVLNDEGRVDAKRLAREIDVSISTLALALGRSARWVSENPTARSIQPPALELIDALDALAVSLGGKKFVRAWFKTPSPEFQGRTPAEILRDQPNGRGAVIGLIGAIVTGEPD